MVAELLPTPAETEANKSARALGDMRSAMESISRAVGGRATTDTSGSTPFFGGSGMWAYMPPPSAEQNWRTLDLDLVSMERISPHKIAELMADLSPEISGGVNDWLRFCNPGYEITALNPGTGKPHPRAQRIVDDFHSEVGRLHGTFDVVVNRLYLGAYMRGAFLSELVGDERGRVPIDIATPDPATVRFRRIFDPLRGDIYDLGQLQAGRFVSLSDRETIRYVPVDPFPGSPYGRPMISASIFLGLFLLGLLRDIRRVVAQQGYPRLDISVDVKRLYESLPQTISNLEEFSTWSVTFLNQIAQMYAQMKPDSAYVHLDSVIVNHPVGALNDSALGAIDGLTKAIERGLARGLKTSPLILGLTEGTSEAQANRQWEIHAARIKAVQHWCEGSLGAHFTQACQMQGVDAVVEVRMAELRSAELLRDEQVKQLQLANAVAAYNEGIISQDEKALYAWGKDTADQEAPRVSAAGAGVAVPDASEVVAEPGANRAGKRARVFDFGDGRLVRVWERIEGSADDLPAVPAKVGITDDDDDEAGEAFDDALPEYAGLLNAEVVE